MVGGYIIHVWGFRKWHEWKWIKFSYKVNLSRDNVFPLYKLKTRHIGGFPWLIEYCCGTASQIKNDLLRLFLVTDIILETEWFTSRHVVNKTIGILPSLHIVTRPLTSSLQTSVTPSQVSAKRVVNVPFR